MFLLNECLDTARVPAGVTAQQICNKISTPDEEAPCVSLFAYLGQLRTSYLNMGEPRIIHWGWGAGETGGPKAESGGRVLGEGQKPPPYQPGGLGSAVISASGVRGGVPTA